MPSLYRAVATSLLLTGVATAAPDEARALAIDLIQVAGTYDGIAARPGDTLVLEIRVGLVTGDTLKEAIPTIDFDPASMTYDPSHSLQIGIMSCCTDPFDSQLSATFGQISIADGLEAPPGHVDAWGVRSNRGARGPGSFSPGKIAFVLTGLGGSIRTSGAGTSLLDLDGNDVTSSSHLGSFRRAGNSRAINCLSGVTRPLRARMAPPLTLRFARR